MKRMFDDLAFLDEMIENMDETRTKLDMVDSKFVGFKRHDVKYTDVVGAGESRRLFLEFLKGKVGKWMPHF